MVPSKIITQFNKRFYKGDQWIELTPTGDIVEQERSYFYTHHYTYNLVKNYVDKIKKTYSLSESQLFGPNGVVSQLAPLQKVVNLMYSQWALAVEKTICPVLVVEDGSVDTDALEEEGLSPGKILIYRQGSNAPQALVETNAEAVYQQFRNAIQAFDDMCIEISDNLNNKRGK